MPLEPHNNTDFKTGIGIGNWMKNVQVTAEKVNVLPVKNSQVFLEQCVILHVSQKEVLNEREHINGGFIQILYFQHFIEVIQASKNFWAAN